jgi:hypothetical protein
VLPRPGDHRARRKLLLRLEQEIAKCEFIVPVLSPDFVTWEWAQLF